MERIPSSPPIIKPVLDKHNRPLWSIMIPVFNCSEFLVDALQSVLVQDMGRDRMQIEVVDDNSTDTDVKALVEKIGNGRVTYYKQPQNVGSLRNFETCINRSRGELVHLLHGDDRVKDGFYKKFTNLFHSYPQAGAAFCRYHFIDELGKIKKEGKFKGSKEGILEEGLLIMAAHQPTQYVSTVVKRAVYEKLGGFYGVVFGEDWEMWVRIANQYPIAYTPSILADYRRHMGSITSPVKETGQNALDMAKTIVNVEQYLPDNKKYLMEDQKRECMIACIKKANIIRKQTTDKAKAEEMIKLALSFKNRDPDLIFRLVKFYIKLIFNIKHDKKGILYNFLKKLKIS